MSEKKLAVLFPGIGYHCDKPLLYYAAKLAKGEKYEVLPVPYAGFPEKVRGDADRMRACFEIAWSEADRMLEPVDWSAYDNILFIGKSIGTVVGSAYAQHKGLAVHSILLTRSRIRSAMPAGMRSPFTEPLIHGRRRARLWKRAGSGASRCT